METIIKEQGIKVKSVERVTRFTHHIIDTIVYFFILFLHSMVFDVLLDIVPEEPSPIFGIYAFLLYPGYLALFEYFFQKTPGKFLTRSRVVMKDGTKPGLGRIALRNICRLIPFDNVSFLVSRRGWHDEISGTWVVYD